MLRVISRPMTVPAERSIDLNAEDCTTFSTTVGCSGAGRSARGAGVGVPGTGAGADPGAESLAGGAAWSRAVSFS